MLKTVFRYILYIGQTIVIFSIRGNKIRCVTNLDENETVLLHLQIITSVTLNSLVLYDFIGALHTNSTSL